MQDAFTESGIAPEEDSVTLLYKTEHMPGMALKLHYSYDSSITINHLLINVIITAILNYHKKHRLNYIHTNHNDSFLQNKKTKAFINLHII